MAAKDRLSRVCFLGGNNSELDHLKETFTCLNIYPAHLVSKTIRKTLKNSDPRPKPAPSPIRITIPYQGPVTHQIARLIKNKANIDVTFSSGKSIKTHLQANGRGTSCTSPNPRGGINQYIGETLRPLNTRLKEHRTSVNKPDKKSAISEHILKNENHNIMWEATKVLSTNNNNWRLRKLQEAIDIRRHQPAMSRDQGT
ncbi:uncharacterized protein [Haliotis cracherodii]|uniref:uncharacterized protein n=1 Tax=Haliotis cracherodii TaxID=6455 RepID=UPI0039EC8A89